MPRKVSEGREADDLGTRDGQAGKGLLNREYVSIHRVPLNSELNLIFLWPLEGDRR